MHIRSRIHIIHEEGLIDTRTLNKHMHSLHVSRSGRCKKCRTDELKLDYMLKLNLQTLQYGFSNYFNSSSTCPWEKTALADKPEWWYYHFQTNFAAAYRQGQRKCRKQKQSHVVSQCFFFHYCVLQQFLKLKTISVILSCCSKTWCSYYHA